MTDPVSLSALYRLLTFLSPAFPTGAFTYSHGLEQVIDEGGVRNAPELARWLEDILRYGAGRSDAILLKETFQAARRGDAETVRELQELGLALQPSKERHLETSAQGTAFFGAVAKSWLPEDGGQAASLLRSFAASGRDNWPYPVAVGLVCAAHDLPEDAAVTSFLHAFAANIVSAAVRAVPLGQSDGQKVLAALEAVVFDVAAEAMRSGLDDLGSSAFLADIASMAHETQYSRLFRS
ncbi:urease accessory protein UreF [Labrenzia aggregata]|uniref:Urease accessory protein UreF n=2 Tax=Roseibium aggregatum TaxID=187304 RepID=A0A939EHB7_9HYPH|nr:urease accessory protein UreF [Roseibium aggregatum]